MTPYRHDLARPPATHGAWGASRSLGIGLAVVYVATMVAVAWFARPLSVAWLVGVALLPAIAAFLAGIPRVLRGGPRGLMAVFHLGLYPALAALLIGAPAAAITYQIAQLLGP